MDRFEYAAMREKTAPARAVLAGLAVMGLVYGIAVLVLGLLGWLPWQG